MSLRAKSLSPSYKSFSPAYAASLVAPNIDYANRPEDRFIGTESHTSVRSHMTRASSCPNNMNLSSEGVGNRREAKATAEDNVTPRFELFLLGDGEKKVTEEPDTRIPSSSIFTFNKEDHTLGNMLRSRLLQSPHVTFAGYKVPHPLFSQFILRIQTDGTLSPRAALIQTCKDLVTDLSVLSREFTKEWELKKMVVDVGKDEKKDEKDKVAGN